MKKRISKCFVYNEEQEKFLRSKKYKIDRMECFHTLVDKVVLETTLVDISDHRQIELLPGQFMATDVELSRKWGLDRKTCAKLMKKMEELGMFTSTKVAEVTVYSMHIFSGWYVDGEGQKNDYYHFPLKPGQMENYKTPIVNKVIVKPNATELSNGDDSVDMLPDDEEKSAPVVNEDLSINDRSGLKETSTASNCQQGMRQLHFGTLADRKNH